MEPVIPQGLMLYYLYAHADRAFCEILDKHLAPLKRQGWIRIWPHRAVGADQSWEWEIHQQLSQADIVVVLVSCDFLASDICSDSAMTEVIQRHDLGHLVVVP